MIYQFNFRDVFAQFDTLVDGAVLTSQLSAVTMTAGLVIGIVGALARSWGGRPVRLAAATYVETIRNTPLLIQIFIVFFGLPSAGLRFDATTAAVVALSINLGAYATEIIRAEHPGDLQEPVGANSLHHDGEGQAHHHPRRVVLQLELDEVLQLGEVEHRVQAAGGLLLARPRRTPLSRAFSRAVSSGLKPTPSSMNGASRPAIRTVPASGR